MKRIVSALSKIKMGKRAYAVFVVGISTAIALPAQIFSTLHSFDGTDGFGPSGLVQATNGDLYGTTAGDGANGEYGTVFKIAPNGTETTLYSFCAQGFPNCPDGYQPYAGLVQATNGDLYGTTEFGGAGLYGPYQGTIFKITPSGTLTTLYNFCSQSGCADGEEPMAGLVQATNGDFYGTTNYGGANGWGVVFRITPSGTLTTLYSFCSISCTSGGNPSGLVQATNEDLYGTTLNGGVFNHGTVFKMTPGGTLATLYSFCSQGGQCTDGAYPRTGLVQATNGDLYGTTSAGGAIGYGTIFKIIPSGTLTTLYSFCSQSNCTDGFSPGGLVQATNEDLYGTTSAGGANGYGTIFRITPSGTLTTLHSFCSQSGCTDGESPEAGLIQDTDGGFYGTTQGGGANGAGTVFRDKAS
jgi:uncharacterized repeat protein (TIGR03803 family)